MYPDWPELVTCGDVVEKGDTLVLETSAFGHESSTLSIPTRSFKETWPRSLRRRTANAEGIRSNRIVSASIACSSRSLFARRTIGDPITDCLAGRMSGMASHLVGSEAHVVRRVQVQVLLLPPGTGVLSDRSSSLGWTVALGRWEAHPVRGGTRLRGLRVRLAPLPPNLLERFGMWQAGPV